MTFSLLARDDATGLLGLATATHAYGVGPVADHTRPGVGVVATQSFVEVSYGPLGLDLIERGTPAAEALDKLVADDPDSDIRQVAYLDTTGGVAHHTGARCVPSCGAVVDGSVVAVGNMLDNDGVLPAVVEAFRGADGDLADRLLAGLAAGDEAGGDVRGRMSAALRVVTGERPADPWQGTVVDLRVDLDTDPVGRLAESLRIHRAYGVFFESVFKPGLVTGAEPVLGDELEQAMAGLAATQRELGDDLEPTLWRGVLLVRAGRVDEGAALIARAVDARPRFARFVDGMARTGMLPAGSAEILRRAGR
ncbi:DUF1028 domain-containing protein [Jiangella alba]|uniref:Uncharacterized conserved protein, Ntn-hydrolase superfamily n=1 Tax=Jiangella alba TaxID=561176 RepID=A0A1H5KV06_9ACTN|nr:DUF1028 domain-containing protein [Jiangella alba]SEE68530.1 Uncharacterized conserved protein, Ntn-hydrolase superfamily [Jiangella alba]